MDDLTANLFPHTYLGEEGAKRVLSLFDRIIIFVPWYGEPPGFARHINGISIKYPPESLHPGEGFLSLLSEYRNWINQHADRSTLDFLKASRDREADEETTWDIRRSLRRIGGEHDISPAENLPLKWHMILHLARELEEQREEADQALKRLRERRSPLEGVHEDETELEELFGDILRFAEEPPGEAYNMALVLGAWTGLFGGYLREGDFLVTTDAGVMDELSELRSEQGGPEKAWEEDLVTFRWPDLSSLDFQEIPRAREKILKDKPLRQVRSAVGYTVNDPKRALKALQEVSRDLKWEKDIKTFRVRASYLEPDDLGDRTGIKLLAGRTLFLLGD